MSSHKKAAKRPTKTPKSTAKSHKRKPSVSQAKVPAKKPATRRNFVDSDESKNPLAAFLDDEWTNKDHFDLCTLLSKFGNARGVPDLLELYIEALTFDSDATDSYSEESESDSESDDDEVQEIAKPVKFQVPDYWCDLHQKKCLPGEHMYLKDDEAISELKYSDFDEPKQAPLDEGTDDEIEEINRYK